MSREFNTAYKRRLEEQKLQRFIERKKKENPTSTTIEDLLTLMEIKGKQGTFQSFNPRDFGADYDIVSIPKDGTPEADFWLTGIEDTMRPRHVVIKYTDYQDEI